MADSFRQLANSTETAWDVWQRLEFFLDEHGFDLPRGMWDREAKPQGWRAPVVEFARETSGCIVYRCDGMTLLGVTFDEDERGPRILSVEVSRS